MTARQYRKRPVVVQAIQWTGDNEVELRAWTEQQFHLNGFGELWVDKSVNYAVVKTGTWVIEEPTGEGYYPCSETDFAATYEPVEPEVCDYCGAEGHQIRSTIGGAPVNGCPRYDMDSEAYEEEEWHRNALILRRIVKALPGCLTPQALQEIDMHLAAGLGDDEAVAEYRELTHGQ